MPLRFAFTGFRHPHINECYKLVQQNPGTELAGACEEDAGARAELAKAGTIKITHDSFSKMLDSVPCDVVAIGDCFGRRGALAIEALKRGKHVIADKPLCTSLKELDEIERLAKEKKLSVGCQLGMRFGGKFLRLKELVDTGKLGTVHQIAVGGQHPLNYGSRAAWYWQPGMHGGTINDIAIHLFSTLEWMTGKAVRKVVAARAWNAFASEVPHFKDSAQFLLELDGGCGVLGDMSYAMPSGLGYKVPQYWRTTLFGTGGIAETSASMDHVTFVGAQDKEIAKLAPLPGDEAGYFESFLNEIAGQGEVKLSTAEVIACSRTALRVQEAADSGARDVELQG